jgi:hypothetical protein
VAQRAPLAPRSVDEALLEASERVRAAERRAAELERRVAAAERRAERAEDLLGDARRRARRAGERERRARGSRERVRVLERESRMAATEQVELLTVDAEVRVRAAYDQAEAAIKDALEARRAQRAAEARAADAEARAGAAERLERAARTELSGKAVHEAWKGARAAEERATAAERRARELASLVCGEPRRLTPGELAELRDAGPTGPAVMALALRTLHRARAASDRRAVIDALGDVASAAVGWRDRL